MLGAILNFRAFLKLEQESQKQGISISKKESESSSLLDFENEAQNVYSIQTQTHTYFNGTQELTEEITEELIPVSKSQAIKKVNRKIIDERRR